MDIKQKILNLTAQLFPTGRAFRIPYGGVKEKLFRALSESEKDVYNDVVSILDSILPDNSNFTTTDASEWEVRLGMIDGSASTLSDRKSAIQRKINHPGDIPARQSHDYLQEQLQAAGFLVYVHENIPEVPILGSVIQSGQIQCGLYQCAQAPYLNKVVNSIDESVDSNYATVDNLRSVFTIGGAVLGSSTTVLAVRKDEFRQLILKIKPVQTQAFLRITYV